jgi:hypothetical protein
MNTPLMENEPPDTYLEEVRAFWRETGQDFVRDSIKTIDKTARQIIVVAGILEGLYFHAISFSNLRDQINNSQVITYTLPLIMLALSILAATIVFYPNYYRLNILSSTGSKAIYEDIVKSKLFYTRIAAVLLVLGAVGIAVAMLTYLQG